MQLRSPSARLSSASSTAPMTGQVSRANHWLLALQLRAGWNVDARNLQVASRSDCSQAICAIAMLFGCLVPEKHYLQWLLPMLSSPTSTCQASAAVLQLLAAALQGAGETDHTGCMLHCALLSMPQYKIKLQHQMPFRHFEHCRREKQYYIILYYAAFASRTTQPYSLWQKWAPKAGVGACSSGGIDCCSCAGCCGRLQSGVRAQVEAELHKTGLLTTQNDLLQRLVLDIFAAVESGMVV